MNENRAKADNPAGRLYVILNRAKTIGGGTASQAFAKALELSGFKDDDLSELYIRLGHLSRLLDEIDERLKESGESGIGQVFAKHRPRLKQSINVPHFGQNWDEWKKRIFNEDLTALEMCSEVLSRYSTEVIVPKNELDQLLKDVDRLYESVMGADLDPDLRAIILEELARIRTAIHEYAIRGSAGLREALSNGLVAVLENEKFRDEETQKRSGHAISEFLNLLASLMTILQFAQAVRPQLEPIIQHLKLLTGN